jgi:PIN domain nuclease of toxin-antitoxin system
MTMPSVVLDASAILAVLNREAGADAIMAEIDDAIVLSVNYAEVASKLIEQGKDWRLAKEAIFGLGVRIADFDVTLADRTGELRPITKHRGLSLGDRACLALAEQQDALVLTTDHSWRDVIPNVEIRVVR